MTNSKPDPSAGVLIGVDTGGTFTDVALLDSATGRMWVTKTASTPEDPSIGFGNGVSDGIRLAGVDGARVGRVLHGTTVATNLILENKGPQAAILVTTGFRHILEIARQSVPEGYGNSYFWVKPERIVPLDLVHEVGGRLNFQGKELRKLDRKSTRLNSSH